MISTKVWVRREVEVGGLPKQSNEGVVIILSAGRQRNNPPPEVLSFEKQAWRATIHYGPTNDPSPIGDTHLKHAVA